MKLVLFWVVFSAGTLWVLDVLNAESWQWWQWALFIYAEICVIGEADKFSRSKA